MTIVPHMTNLSAVAVQVTLTFSVVATMVALGIYVMHLRESLRAAQERLHLYSWNLRQFVPAAIGSEAS